MLTDKEFWLLFDAAERGEGNPGHWSMMRWHVTEVQADRDRLLAEVREFRRRQSGGHGASSDADWDAE